MIKYDTKFFADSLQKLTVTGALHYGVMENNI